MRLSPSESATKFKINTKKRGNDGNMWVVKKTRAGVKRWTKNTISRRKSKTSHDDEKSSVVFVFYKMAQPGMSWNYPKLPHKWWWVGSGGTSNPNYPNEEQFSGSGGNRDSMVKLLKEVFSKLKKKGIIEKFKVRRNYAP